MDYTEVYCDICGTRKTANGIYKGKQKWRNNCDCKAINKKVIKNINNEKKLINKINNDLINNHPPFLTDDEIIYLKQFISNGAVIKKEEILEYYKNDKKNRTIKSVNFDVNLYELLINDSKQKRISVSDLVNCIVNNYYS